MYNNLVESFNESLEEIEEVGSLNSQEGLSLVEELSNFIAHYKV